MRPSLYIRPDDFDADNGSDEELNLDYDDANYEDGPSHKRAKSPTLARQLSAAKFKQGSTPGKKGGRAPTAAAVATPVADDDDDEGLGAPQERPAGNQGELPIFTFVEVDRSNWPRAIRGKLVHNNVMGSLEYFRSGNFGVYQRTSDGLINASQMLSCLNITQYHANKILQVLMKNSKGNPVDLRDKKDQVINGLW